MTKRVLIVYYSRSGTTRIIARALSDVLGCDMDEIVETRSRAGFLGYMRSLFEASQKRPSAAARWNRDPSSYDLIVIGSPVWAWSVSSPVRAYLIANKERFSKAAFFCTLGGSGSESAFEEMRSLAGKAPAAVCAFSASEVTSESYHPRLSAFAAALREAVSMTNRA